MYYFTTKGETPLGYAENPFVFGAMDINEKGKLVFYHLGQILTDDKLQDLIALDRNVQITYRKFSDDTNYVLPYVYKATGDYTVDLYDDYSLQSLCYDSQGSEENISAILDMLEDGVTSFNGFTEHLDDFKKFLKKSQDILFLICSNSFYYRVRTNSARIADAINQYNEFSNSEYKNYSAELEETPVCMKKCDDKVFLTIPDCSYLNSSIMEIYEEERATFFRNVFTLESYIRPFSIAASEINAETYHKHYDKATQKVEDGVLDNFSSKYIHGTEDNNYLPLQSNEQQFYDKLVNTIHTLLVDNIKTFNKSKTISQEEIERYEKGCIIDSSMPLKVMIDAFLYLALNINWRFKPYIPLEMFNSISSDVDSEEDSEANSTGAESEDGLHVFVADPNLSEDENDRLMGLDIIKIIDQFITSNKCTIYAYAEVIIKLLRWGDRKPNKLILNFDKSKGDNEATEVLDLVNLRISYDEKMANIETTGAPKLVGIIYSSKEDFPVERNSDCQKAAAKCGIELLDDFIRTPIGIIASQKYTIGTGDNISEQERFILIDHYTLVKRFMKGNLKIIGIDYKDGKFTVDNAYLLNIQTSADDDLDSPQEKKFEMLAQDIANSSNRMDTRKITRYFYNNDFANLFKSLFSRGVQGVPESPSQEQLNSCNILEVLSDLMSYGAINVLGIFGDKETATVRILVAKTLFKYFKQSLEKAAENGETLSLEQSLNLFAGILTNPNNSSNTSQSSTGSNKTNLFSDTGESNKDEEISLFFNVNTLWVFCINNELVFRDINTVDKTKCKKGYKGHNATKALCVYLLKPKEYGVHFTEETKSKILAELKKFYGSDDPIALYKYVQRVQQGGK